MIIIIELLIRRRIQRIPKFRTSTPNAPNKVLTEGHRKPGDWKTAQELT